MNASIDDKIKQLDELSMRAINFDKDFNEIGEVKRKLFLLIKYCFGENSAYMNDYNKIEVPEEDDDQQINAKNLKQLQRAVTKLLEIMDTMTEDLQISKSLTNSHVEANKPKSNNIFIVHGTDHKPAKELNNILKEAGLTPIILHEQPSGSMTIIEKLEKYSHVGFAFIVLTPDDSGVSKKEIRDLLSAELGKENATTSDVFKIAKTIEQLRDRARQNVVLEFGYFMGRLNRDRVCCLYKGNIELPSDMHGICYLHFNNSVNEIKQIILKELKAVGYDTNV